MGIPKLWGKNKDGKRGFVFSHIETIYYNWASKILLKTKLDEMDKLIEEKVAKAMLSSQQVNDANRVPTSALAYQMGNNITKNANDIAALNSNFAFGGECTSFRSGLNMDQDIATLQLRLDSENYISLINADQSLYVDKVSGSKVKRLFTAVSKDDLAKNLISGPTGWVAIQANQENPGGNSCRVQLYPDGTLSLYKSTDNGQNWNWSGEYVLKSNLGNPGTYRIVATNVTDLDNPPNCFILESAPDPVGLPTELYCNSVLVLQLFPGRSDYGAQLAFGFRRDKLAIRRKDSSQGTTTIWTDWKYFTAP